MVCYKHILVHSFLNPFALRDNFIQIMDMLKRKSLSLSLSFSLNLYLTVAAVSLALLLRHPTLLLHLCKQIHQQFSLAKSCLKQECGVKCVHFVFCLNCLFPFHGIVCVSYFFFLLLLPIW